MSFPYIIIAAASKTPGVYYAYENSDAVGKLIVLLLLVGSVLTWTVMIDKVWTIYQAKRQAKKFVQLFRQHGEENLLHMVLVREQSANQGPIAAIYRAGVEKLLEFYTAEAEARGISLTHGVPPACELSEAQFNALEAVLEREVSSQLEKLETRIGMLATLVSLSPFCGLFGTVWGVMMAFCGVAIAGKPNFTALAPGVAGALLTTVAGLVVAIPSLVGYNLLTGTIRQLTVQMDNFSEEFIADLRLAQLRLSGKENKSGRVQ